MWLGKIILSFADIIASEVEHYATLVIQAMDLGFIVPVFILSGVLLIKNRSFGYLLALIMIIKAVTLLLAVDMMIIFMKAAGVKVSTTEIISFTLFTILCFISLLFVLINIREEKSKTLSSHS